jgi:hypothetical protein
VKIRKRVADYIRSFPDDEGACSVVILGECLDVLCEIRDLQVALIKRYKS